MLFLADENFNGRILTGLLVALPDLYIIPDKHLIPLDDATMALIDKNEASLRIGLYPTGGGPNLLRMPAPMDEPEFAILPLLLGD